MRILIVGDRNWTCPRLAEKIVNRLLDRYGGDMLIIHGGEPGVDQTIATACQAHGVQHEGATSESVSHRHTDHQRQKPGVDYHSAEFLRCDSSNHSV